MSDLSYIVYSDDIRQFKKFFDTTEIMKIDIKIFELLMSHQREDMLDILMKYLEKIVKHNKCFNIFKLISNWEAYFQYISIDTNSSLYEKYFRQNNYYTSNNNIHIDVTEALECFIKSDKKLCTYTYPSISWFDHILYHINHVLLRKIYKHPLSAIPQLTHIIAEFLV